MVLMADCKFFKLLSVFPLWGYCYNESLYKTQAAFLLSLSQVTVVKEVGKTFLFQCRLIN